MLIALSLLSTIESAKVYNPKTMTDFLYEMRLQDITSWTGYLFRGLQLLWLPTGVSYGELAMPLEDNVNLMSDTLGSTSDIFMP